jgi:hypothetical protein
MPAAAYLPKAEISKPGPVKKAVQGWLTIPARIVSSRGGRSLPPLLAQPGFPLASSRRSRGEPLPTHAVRWHGPRSARYGLRARDCLEEVHPSLCSTIGSLGHSRADPPQPSLRRHLVDLRVNLTLSRLSVVLASVTTLWLGSLSSTLRSFCVTISSFGTNSPT